MIEDEDREVTPEERRAIASLLRLAKRWPASLTLASMGGSLHVIPSDHRVDGNGGLDPDEVLADIDGIPSTGGDW